MYLVAYAQRVIIHLHQILNEVYIHIQQ